MTEEKAKMRTGKKIAIGLIMVFVVLTAAAHFFGVNYFTGHFLPGSMVNGFNCSYMTVAEAEELLAKKAASFALTIETRNNGVEGITAEEAGLVFVSDGSVEKLVKEQDRYQWFLAFNQNKTYTVPTSLEYDQEKLAAAVDGLNCMKKENIIQPVDAAITDNGSEFVIEPETEGNAPDRDKVIAAVGTAMRNSQPVLNLEKGDCYRKPVVYRDDEQLAKNCAQMNELADIVITYDFADRTETVDRNVIKNWFTLNKKGNVTLDKKLVAEYVDELGYKYDTFGLPRTFYTYDNREKYLPTGDYGWVIDAKAETKALIEAIKSGETQVREPVYLYSGWSRDTNDIGYTYVEIDLTNQRLVFYKDGYPIVDTLVVTGNPNIPGCETPEGCYAIDAKKSPSTLVGEDYAAEVTFWMPFAGNVGIHDAVWRTEFGGNLYLLEGSHGCVNVPYDQAQVIYENIEIGMPVVVYK